MKTVKFNRQIRLLGKFCNSLVYKRLRLPCKSITGWYTSFDFGYAQNSPKTQNSTKIIPRDVKTSVFPYIAQRAYIVTSFLKQPKKNSKFRLLQKFLNRLDWKTVYFNDAISAGLFLFYDFDFDRKWLKSGNLSGLAPYGVQKVTFQILLFMPVFWYQFWGIPMIIKFFSS